jgi:Superinfection immunity protein
MRRRIGVLLLILAAAVLALGFVPAGRLTTAMSSLGSSGLVALAFGLYFIPTIVANLRSAKGQNGVLVVNLFLGWTLIGWVVALAWAAAGEKSAAAVPAA